MQTRSATDAKRKLAELGITSATVLTGSTTITLDLAAFDELVGEATVGFDLHSPEAQARLRNAQHPR